MLISRVLPIMSIHVYRFPHGQYAYGGHVVNLPQDINTFVNTLPRSPSTLDVLIVRREGAAESHKDFKVRCSVILSALQWLVGNNIFYRDVTIDTAVLTQLHVPLDGDLSTFMSTVNMPSSDDEYTNVPPSDDNDSTSHLVTSFIPLPLRGVTEQEAIQQSVDGRAHVSWPSTGGNPINEFTTGGYMSCAFPTPFSFSDDDFLPPPSQVKLADVINTANG